MIPPGSTSRFARLIALGAAAVLGLSLTWVGPALATVPGSTPTARADRLQTAEDVAATLDPLENDSGPLLASSVTVAAQPLHGSAVVGAGGRITYTPATHYNGADSFFYSACDASNSCLQARVSVTVTLLGSYQLIAGRSATAETVREQFSFLTDGSRQRPLDFGNPAQWVAISPTRDKVAVATGGSLQVSSIDGGPTAIGVTMPYPVVRPAWNPTGTKIVFSSFNPAFGPVLYQLDTGPLGGEADPLTYITGPGQTAEVVGENPSWGDFGIVFDSFVDETRTSYPGLSLVIPGDRPTPLGGAGTGAAQPSWSPDGTEIVYATHTSTAPVAGFDVAVLAGRITSLGNSRTLASGHDDYGTSLAYPAWSPDGSKVVYTNGNGVGVVNSDGSNGRSIPLVGCYCNHPSWDPRPVQGSPTPESHPGRLLYVQETSCLCGPGSGAVHRMSPNTSGDTDFLSTVGAGTLLPGSQDQPRWSPDGTRLAFSAMPLSAGSANIATRALWVINADGTGLTKLTNVGFINGSADEPTWSPDGTRLAFTLDRYSVEPNGTRGIWTVGADGTGLARLATTGQNYSPAWSPDGQWVAYVSAASRKVELIAADGLSAPVAPVGSPAGASDPAWSPDGKTLAVITRDLTLLSFSASPSPTLTPLRQFALGSSDPAWSPDGTALAFGRDAYDNGISLPNPSVWVMNLDDTRPQMVSEGAASAPDWGGRTAGPRITSVSPNTGPPAGGTQVTLTGTGFGGPGTTVTFDGVDAPVTSGSATSLLVMTPPHAAQSVDVVVTNPDGQTATAAFTYAPVAPAVTSVSPSSGPAAGGTSVTVTGTGFGGPGTAVSFGGVAATVTSGSPTSLTVTTPAHAAGAVDVTVSNPDGQAGTLASGYTYGNPAPTISSVSPSSGPAAGGTTVTVTGTGFGGPGTAVSFGGVAATVTSGSPTSLTVTTPAHAAGAVTVRVANPDGQSATLASGYTYLAPQAAPKIKSVKPGRGPAAGGTSVQITGTGFGGPGTTVSFGGSPATVVSGSSTSITVITPAHAAGVVAVAVRNPDGQSASLARGFTYR